MQVLHSGWRHIVFLCAIWQTRGSYTHHTQSQLDLQAPAVLLWQLCRQALPLISTHPASVDMIPAGPHSRRSPFLQPVNLWVIFSVCVRICQSAHQSAPPGSQMTNSSHLQAYDNSASISLRHGEGRWVKSSTNDFLNPLMCTGCGYYIISCEHLSKQDSGHGDTQYGKHLENRQTTSTRVQNNGEDSQNSQLTHIS